MPITRRSPIVRVNFFTERGNVTVAHHFQDSRTHDQLLSVTTAKTLKAPAGTFSVVMTDSRFQGNFDEHRSYFSDQPGNAGRTEIIARNSFGWKDILRPGDLVVIEMGPDRSQPAGSYYEKNFTRDLFGNTEIVMIGSIDDIRSQMEMGGDGKPTRRVTVTGRDFGKYLVDDQIWDSPWWNEVSQTLAFRLGLEGLQGLPARIIQHVVQRWIFESFDVEFDINARGSVRKTGRRKLSEILRLALDATSPEIPYGQNWLAFEGSPWALFTEMQGAPFYVLQIDTRRQNDVEALLQYTTKNPANPRTVERVDTEVASFRHIRRDLEATTTQKFLKGQLSQTDTAKALDQLRGSPPFVWNTNLSRFNSQVVLMYYRNPWSNREYEDWTKLPTRVITRDDVISEEVGVGLEEIVTRWLVLPQAPSLNRTDFKTAAEKQHAPELERRFGFRPKILRVPFFRDTGDVALFRLANRLQKRVRDWDLHNIDYLSGRYQIEGMAAARVGDRLHYDPAGDGLGIDYYVEGVQQEFVAFTSWHTTLEVTRGQAHRDVGTLLFDAEGKANPNAVRAFGRTG
jgi:hypothetical protein